jgi:4-hydroxy-2-oxoglutarate aldolase
MEFFLLKEVFMRKDTISMAGIFPPIPTPFDAAGELDLEALAFNFKKWDPYPIAGYVILGTNGEFPYLSEPEKLAYLEAARKHIPPGKLFLAGVGCESTHSTVTLVKKVAALGADVALLITPSYYKSKMDGAALAHYYQAVSDASPIPVSIYNMPANTNVDMSAELIIKLSQHPNIIGVKDSSGNLAKLGEILRYARPGFQVLAGSAGFLYPALCLGAIGGVLALSNIAPQQCCDILHFFHQGLHAEAKELQLRLIAANDAVTSRFGVAGLKAAMEIVGFYGGPPRSPLQPLNNEQRAVLRGILKEAGII